MNKRPYYVITHDVDWDGYATYVDYIGVNAKAAIERYNYIFRQLKTQYFDNEGVDPEHINTNFADNIQPKVLTVGSAYTSYINDDDQCWISITLRTVNTGEFIRSDYRNREEEYKQNYPNAKY